MSKAFFSSWNRARLTPFGPCSHISNLKHLPESWWLRAVYEGKLSHFQFPVRKKEVRWLIMQNFFNWFCRNKQKRNRHVIIFLILSSSFENWCYFCKFPDFQNDSFCQRSVEYHRQMLRSILCTRFVETPSSQMIARLTTSFKVEGLCLRPAESAT